MLLARAAPLLTLRGRWFLPGGGVQHGESPPDSLRREITEESGLTIVPGPLLDVLSDVRTLPDGTSLHTVRLIYEVASWHGSLRPEVDGTTDAVAWFSLDEVRDSPVGALRRDGRGPARVNAAPAAGSDSRDTRHHVVIVGCGFGGLFAARALKREPVRVTIIDRTNHHLFQPLLYQVATGILSEGQIAPAIRDVMRRAESVNVVLGEVEHIDVAAKEVHVDEFGKPLVISYDSLIVAGGASTSYFGHDEFRRAASGMKSLDDALALRGEIFGAFELAEAETDDEARRRLMTFVVVGGGPTGVEISGQLRELSRAALRRNYRRINPQDTRVVLVEGTDHLLGSMGSRVARLTERKLTRMGVELHLGAMVSGMDDEAVVVTEGGRQHGAGPRGDEDLGRRDPRLGPGRDPGQRGGRRARQGGPGAGAARLLAARAPRGVRRR